MVKKIHLSTLFWVWSFSSFLSNKEKSIRPIKWHFSASFRWSLLLLLFLPTFKMKGEHYSHSNRYKKYIDWEVVNCFVNLENILSEWKCHQSGKDVLHKYTIRGWIDWNNFFSSAWFQQSWTTRIHAVPLSMFSFQFTPIFWTASNQFNNLRNAAGKHGLEKCQKPFFMIIKDINFFLLTNIRWMGDKEKRKKTIFFKCHTIKASDREGRLVSVELARLALRDPYFGILFMFVDLARLSNNFRIVCDQAQD